MRLIAKGFKQNINDALTGMNFNYLRGELEVGQRKWLKELREYIKEEKPRSNRKRPDFPLGVVVWILKDGKYYRGVSAFGWRTQDGCVSGIFKDFPETKDKPIGCGVGTPTMLFDHEYQLKESRR